MADKTETVLSLLAQASYPISSSSSPPPVVIHDSQKMGYSGATVYDVTIDGLRLFIKHVVLGDSSPDKKERDRRSYMCDAYCLSNLEGCNVPKLHAGYMEGDVVVNVMASLNDTHSTAPPAGMDYCDVLKDLIVVLARLHAGKGKVRV